ncbi:hypothetical protein [Campylobacter helveticus]|uniref:hypothetical protein n=1 Tax=Campylobacter helveticus TaxID=28898 RepID=UPI0022EB3FF5|nr:hypothetical protein [Campylobacter helveticus]
MLIFLYNCDYFYLNYERFNNAEISTKLSYTRGGGNSSFQPLKRFTLFSCSSLIFTGLLTVDLNAQTITITNNDRFINSKYHNHTLIVNSHLNRGNYQGYDTSLGIYHTTIQKLDIQQGASIDSWVDIQDTAINQMDISGQTKGFFFRQGTKITTLDLKQEGLIRLMYMRNNTSIKTLNISGTLASWPMYGAYGGLNIGSPNARINTINVNQGGSIQNGVKNSGTIQTLTINQGQVHGGVSNSGTLNTLNLNNNGTINGGITNNRTITSISVSNSTVNGNIVNSGSNASTGAINITGTSNVSGNIVNQNGATFNNQITLDAGSKLGGISNAQGSTMSGTLNLSGEVGTISNAGIFSSQLNLSNEVGTIENKQGGTISHDITINNGGSVGTINNAGTMQNITNNNGTLSKITNSGTMKVITNNGTVTLTLTNSRGTIDKVTNETGATATIHNTGTINNEIENKGTATIHNQGKITKGIINDGGTLTVVNDFRRTEGIKDFQTIGEIGKTAKGVHIENKSGKLNIPIWYFNKEEYTTQEEAKQHALLVDGDYANISLENAFVSTHNLDVDETYDAYSLIADKNGNMIGDKINNGQGVNINKLYSVSGIYTFENYGGKGRYRAIINRDELSGRTLAQSIIYSQRVRNVNLSRMLREATTQVFVSGKKSEVNGSKSLSQLERLHTNHRDENSHNHSFVIPYYQNFRANLGSETGTLKSNSSGMLIATQRQLPNDYGVLGIYTGFENVDQRVNAQRLEIDGNSYYAGLTYKNSFYEDDLTTYFMNLTTKIDYIKRDVTKSYRGYIGSASSTAEVFGYGANARVGLSHYLKNDAKISPQIGFNYLGMHSKPFTLNHLGGTREHYLSQNFNFIDAVATVKYETPWINRFKTAVALGTIINVYKDAKGTLHLDSNVLNAVLDIARLYGVVQGGISYDLTKDSDISLGYSGIFSSANTIRSHALMFRYAWWW